MGLRTPPADALLHMCGEDRSENHYESARAGDLHAMRAAAGMAAMKGSPIPAGVLATNPERPAENRAGAATQQPWRK